MASGLLVLLDDIATILDDVAVMTKIAAKKTAGILGDDLALNAQQVTGVNSNRELPVVWAVAKGSFWNKAILVPSALVLSRFAPWTIEPLMIAGGTFLCFEGSEKIAHKYFHPEVVEEHQQKHEVNIAEESVDLVELEKTKVKGAIRTDFILSAEIVVITLGSVGAATFSTQIGVLIAISLLMTVGVYGLVAGIVKLDDIGIWMINTPADRSLASTRQATGKAIIAAAPYLMRFLSIAGTAAMFLVGGGILAHGIPAVHHWVEGLTERLSAIETFGSSLAWTTGLLSNALLGIAVGTVVLLIVNAGKSIFGKRAPTA